MIMKGLVSAKAERILNIMEYTLYRDNVSFEAIMELNHCSKATAKADINYLYTEWQEQLNMTLDDHSFKIDNDSMGDLMEIKFSLLQDEITIKVLMNVYFNPNHTVYDHALDLGYSESYLRKQIMKINGFLKSIGASIQYHKIGDDSTVSLDTNNQVALMHFMTNLFIAANYSDVIKLDLDYDDSVFSEFLKEMNLQVTIHMEEYLKVLGFITHVRYDQKIITRRQMRLRYEAIYSDMNFQIFYSEFQDSLEAELSSYFGEDYILQHQADFKGVADVLMGLILRMMVSPGNVDSLFNRYNIFYKRFAVQHTRGHRIFNRALHRYSSIVKRDFSDYYGEIMYHLYVYLPNIRPKTSYVVGVYSDLGLTHAYSLLQFFETHFPILNVSVYDEAEDYDFVFTTKRVDAINSYYEAVSINDILGKEDIALIYATIYNRFTEILDLDSY